MKSLILPSPDELRHILQTANPGLVFSQNTKRQVAHIVAGKFVDQAVRRKNVDGITVDGPTTLDADDAIWGERTKKGYRVYVTITDVSEVIGIFSPVDIEALTRAVSIYLSPGEIPMIHEHISHDKYSLNGKRPHIGITTVFDVSFHGELKAYTPFESLLHHKGKFTHEQASHILQNRDEQHHSQFAILSEVAELINRAEGRDLGLNGISEAGSAQVGSVEHSHLRIHKIIETLMVSANRIIASELSTEPLGIYRKHTHRVERAFYSANIGPHAGLGIQRGGYTHFTSPLRRYADLLAHRLLKYKLRNERAPYQLGHINAIIEYINRRVLEIDTIQQYRKHEEAGMRSIKKIQDRHGRNPRANELKPHIRRAANESYLLPHAVRACILEDIEDPDSRNWQWAVGIILLGNDDILKQALWNEVITKRAIAPLAFLNSLAETRLILGEDKVFELRESIEASSCSASMKLQDGKTLSVKKPFPKKYTANHIRGKARRDLMFKIFRYYMGK